MTTRAAAFISHAAEVEWLTLADETAVSCSSRDTIKFMLKPAVGQHLVKLVVAGADCFGDVCLHRQLTVEMDAEIKNGLDSRSVKGQGHEVTKTVTVTK